MKVDEIKNEVGGDRSNRVGCNMAWPGVGRLESGREFFQMKRALIGADSW